MDDFFVLDRSFRDDFAVGVCDEGLAPEFGAVVGAAAVDGGKVTTIGDGVSALDGFPCAVLSATELSFFFREPANGGGVDKNLSAAESHQASCFGIPLVPADEHAEFSKLRIPNRPVAIAGSEIEFLFESGVLRDVGFAVEAEHFAIGIMDGSGVVVEAGSTVLEERGDEHDAEFFGDLAKAVSDRAREFVSQVEVMGILNGAEVGRQEKLLGHHDVRAIGCRLADQLFMMVEGLFLGGEGLGLEQGDAWHGDRELFRFHRNRQRVLRREVFLREFVDLGEIDRGVVFVTIACEIESVRIRLGFAHHRVEPVAVVAVCF